MKLKNAVLVLTGLLTGSTALADGAALELADVVRRGLAFSPEVKTSQANYEAARASSSQAERTLFPTVQLVSSGAFNKEPTRLGTSPSLTTSSSDELYTAYLKLTQPLYKGGLLTNGIASQKLAEEIAHQNLISARQTAISQLVSSYYDLASAERHLMLAAEQKGVLDSYAQIVGRYEKIGRARRMDRLQAAVNLSLGEADRVKSERDRVVASDALKRLLGLTEVEPLSGRMQISIAPAAPVTIEQALAAALANNPDYRATELKLNKQEYDNNLDLVEDFPSLDLQAIAGYKAPDRSEWFDEASRYQSIGVNLTIPLFSGLTSFSKRRRHSELMKVAEHNLESARLNLRQQIQAALMTLNSEYTRLTAAQTAAEQGREALRLANTAYSSGVASSQDVLNAQRTRYDSEKLLVDSQFSYLKALLDLRRLMGVDLEKIYAK